MNSQSLTAVHLLKKLKAQSQFSSTSSYLEPNQNFQNQSPLNSFPSNNKRPYKVFTENLYTSVTNSNHQSVINSSLFIDYSPNTVPNNNQQCVPTTAEIYQLSNSDVIIITETSAEAQSIHHSTENFPDSISMDNRSDTKNCERDNECRAHYNWNCSKKVKFESDHSSQRLCKQISQCNNQDSVKHQFSVSKHGQHVEVESEDSTNYETCDFTDFCGFFPCKHEKYQKMEEFKSDDEISFFDSTTCSDEDCSYLKEAFDVANQYKGSFISKKLTDQKALLKFMCKFGHSFELNLTEIKEKWCPRCHKLLEGLHEHAKAHGGTVINKIYNEKITYQCKEQHSWTVNHKNAKRRWCSRCAKDERMQSKQKIEQDKQRKHRKDQEAQKKLFEEAQRQSFQEAMNNSFIYANIRGASNLSGNRRKINPASYFEKIEVDTHQLARKYAAEYLSSKHVLESCNQEQALQVYKVILMPEQVLQSYMFNLPVDALKSDFRRIIKLLHPDKNSHPQAGLAFQKIYRVYESALGRLSV